MAKRRTRVAYAGRPAAKGTKHERFWQKTKCRPTGVSCTGPGARVSRITSLF